jgi:hypothetical protein
MKTTSKSKFVLHFFLFLSLLCGNILFAEEAASAENDSSEQITQGQGAVLLVRRLGLWQDSGIVLTQNEAISRLKKLKIAPLGGWDAEAPLSVNELARMLAQALRLDEDFSEDEKMDPEATAHKEALIAQHNLDIDDLVQQLARNKAQIPSAVGQMGDSTESDPILRPNPPETDGFNPVPTEEDLLAILVAVQEAVTTVQSPAQDITPSAP